MIICIYIYERTMTPRGRLVANGVLATWGDAGCRLQGQAREGMRALVNHNALCSL